MGRGFGFVCKGMGARRWGFGGEGGRIRGKCVRAVVFVVVVVVGGGFGSVGWLEFSEAAVGVFVMSCCVREICRGGGIVSVISNGGSDNDDGPVSR